MRIHRRRPLYQQDLGYWPLAALRASSLYDRIDAESVNWASSGEGPDTFHIRPPASLVGEQQRGDVG